MAHFGRPREKFSNGTLPKPKPYTKEMFKKQSDLYLQGYFGAEDKELYKNNLENVFKKGVEEGVVSEEEALKWIQDRKKIYTTLIEEAGKQPAEFPPAYSVEPDINKYYENQLATGGRVNGRLKAGGPLLLAPYLLPYAAAFLGIAGATGLVLQQKIQNYFTDKPEEVTKFKEYLKTQNVPIDREPENWSPSFANEKDDLTHKSVTQTGLGLDIGDKGEKEKERQRILEEENKKLREGRWGSPDDKINIPIHTGHPPFPPEKWEPPISYPPKLVDAQLPPFPDLSEEFNKPQIHTMAKEKTLAQDKKEVKKKLDEIEPYRGADFIGTSTKKDRTKDKAFLEAFELFKNTHFGGNESAAARAINESRERIRALRLRITTTDRREEGGKFSTAHEEKITTEVPENPIRSVDATTAVKKDQNYFKDFLTKENKNEYMSPQNLANALDFYFKNKGERDNFIQVLNQLKVKNKEVSGKTYRAYKLSDVVNKLTEKNKKKNVAGDVLSKTNRKLAENKLDPVLYRKVLNTIKARVNTNIADLKYKSSKPNYAVDDIGHPISIKETNEFPKLFKNSDVNKINSLVYEDPLINQEVKKVTGYETKHIKWFKELNDMVGKEITKDQRTRLEDIQQEMEDNYLELLKNIGKFDNLKAILKKARPDLNISDSYIKYLTNQVDRQSKIDIKIPNIGEKFKSEDIFVDMSNVDERYIIGHINKINPTAKVFNDLSKEEKGIYEANVLAQNGEILADYYRKIGLSENEIKDMKDDFYYPVREYRIRKAMGGPVYGFYADQIKNLKIP